LIFGPVGSSWKGARRSPLHGRQKKRRAQNPRHSIPLTGPADRRNPPKPPSSFVLPPRKTAPSLLPPSGARWEGCSVGPAEIGRFEPLRGLEQLAEHQSACLSCNLQLAARKWEPRRRFPECRTRQDTFLRQVWVVIPRLATLVRPNGKTRSLMSGILKKMRTGWTSRSARLVFRARCEGPFRRADRFLVSFPFGQNFEPVSDRLIHKRPNLMDRPPVGPQRANQPLYASSFSTFNGVMPVVTPTPASSSIPAPISSPTTNQSTAVVPHHHRYHQLSLLLASGTNFEAPDSYQVSVAPYTTTSAVVPHHHHNRRPSQASTNSSHGTLYNTDTEMAMDDPATPAGYDSTTPAGWDQMQDEGINAMSVSAPPAFEQNKPPSDMD